MSLLSNLPSFIVREIILYYGVDADQKKKMKRVLRDIENYVPWVVLIKKPRTRRPIELDYDEYHEVNAYDDYYYTKPEDFQMNHDINEYSAVKSRYRNKRN